MGVSVYYSTRVLSKTVNVCSAYTGSCSYSKRTINAPLTWRKVASALHNVAADYVKPHFIVFIRWLVWYSIHIISLFAFFLHGWLSWKLSYVAHCMVRAQGWCTLLEFILYILSKWADIRLFVKVFVKSVQPSLNMVCDLYCNFKFKGLCELCLRADWYPVLVREFYFKETTCIILRTVSSLIILQ